MAAETVKRTYDFKRSYNVTANMAIINRLFTSKKNENKKNEYFYDIIRFSRTKFYKMTNGGDYFFSPKAKAEIRQEFGFSESEIAKFFSRDGAELFPLTIAVADEEREAWSNLEGKKVFPIVFSPQTINKEKETDDKDHKTIAVILDRIWEAYQKGMLNRDDPFFKICYRFEQGEAFSNNRLIEQAAGILSQMEPDDWKRLDNDELTDVLAKLDKTRELVNIILKYRTMK